MAQLHIAQPKQILKGIIALSGLMLFALLVVITHVPSGFEITKASATSQISDDASSVEAATEAESGSEDTSKAHDSTQASAKIPIVIHIDGAVAAPGVYSLESGARTQDAVLAAGGLLDSADTTNVNLAAKLSDGQKVHIPCEGEAVQSSGAADTAGNLSSSAASSSGLININTATVDELDTLPGVGPSTAASIVEDRESSGAFSSIEDLMRVNGIGEKKFAKLKDYICV